MRYHTFEAGRTKFSVCFLVPMIRVDEIEKAYFSSGLIDTKDTLILDIDYEPGKKKSSAAFMKTWFTEEVVPTLENCEVEYLAVCDAELFKVLTKAAKVDAKLGYVCDSEFGKFKVVYVPNYKQIFYDPIKVTAKIKQGLEAIASHKIGLYKPPGETVIGFAAYPSTLADIEEWLVKLLEMDCPLACDIEAFSLKHYDAGIGTISFAWNQHEGIAFAVDYKPEEYMGTILNDKGMEVEVPMYGRQVKNDPVRRLLKQFFTLYVQKLIFHNIAYDAYNLIYQLFMHDLLDTEGLLEGMGVMLGNWDCTKLITYLATNSCAGNKLSLKDQAQEFAGNYAVEEIHDIRRIPLPKLLEYNLVDSLSTMYVHAKHYPTMVRDQQENIYETLFKLATLDIIQMQLTGMPLNMKRVIEVRDIFRADEEKALVAMQTSKIISEFTCRLNEEWVEWKNSTLKKKRVTISDANEEFNPNSGPQLQKLLFTHLGLPILGYTDTQQPETGNETLRALLNHATRPDVKDFLQALIDYKDVAKLLSSFIPAMLAAPQAPDGWHYLFGSYNLGGTVSGRLSSSSPNMQNLPAGGAGEKTTKGRYGKLIKSCFQAPPGWIFCGLDFASLEDRISALTTKDPEKLKVYTDGYDGHCLRAFSYFGEQMTGIDPTSVASINSIEKLYKPLRQESKAPTFALTYQGTWLTLVRNCGFTEKMAKQIESRYKELYKVSIQWVSAKLDQATKDGYVTAAFGLRVRTPLLAQVIRGTRSTPAAAEAEGRTAGNALGQGWCLLNSRAGAEFMHEVRKSEFKLQIKPVSQIHDAQYYLVRDNLDALLFTNKYLVEAVEWQEHPDIAHDTVKLGGELSIFHPSWAKEIGIPNGASEDAIIEIINKHLI